MIPKERCLDTIAEILGRGLTRVLNSDPREAAELAHRDGGPSVDELESRIREMQETRRREIALTEKVGA